MKKSLSILLCICLVMTTIYGCFTFTASADPEVVNLWDVEGAPDQSGMSFWNDGNFAGEAGGNSNYILGQANGKVSPYGWRGTSLAAAAKQRAGRLSDSGGIYYHHNPTQPLDCAFVVDLQSDTVRGVSRQIQLEAGKSYVFNFYFKGVVQGFDITALSSIMDTHQSAAEGDSIITSMDYDLSAFGQSFTDVTADNWGYVTVEFTMPEDKSVANFILGEGLGCHAAYDDFMLVEAEPEVVNLWDVKGAPDQSGMSTWNDGYFSGEGIVTRQNYIYGQTSKDDTTPKFEVSAYGWRGYGMTGDENARAGRYDYNANGKYYHGESGAGFMVQLKYADRAVSRQIQLEAGKSYTWSFWFKGFVKGFDIKALDQIYDYHVSDGDSVITHQTADITSNANAFSSVSGDTWEYVTVYFTMPEDKSVANFILYEGNNNYTDAAFDDFLLVESEAYTPGSEPEDPEDPEAPADPNKWLVAGAPDQSGMEPYGVGNFSGENGENGNYIYGQDAEGAPRAKQNSPYGWRGNSLAANANQRAGRYDYNSTANYAHSGTAGFMVEFKYATRAVSRQIMLEGGKTYYFSFWFFGVAKGFKITALDKIYDTHQSDGENIAIANKDVTSTSAEWSTLGNWTFVEMKFTLPEDMPVANFVLAEGDNVAAGFDEFVLLEKEVYVTTSSTSVNGLDGYAGGDASLSASIVDKDDEITATATVDDGFAFDGWYVNGEKVSSNPVDTFTVTEDADYKANYIATNIFNYIDNGNFEKDKQPALHSQTGVSADNGLYTTATEGYDAANVHSGTASYRLTNLKAQGVGNNWWQLQVKEGDSYILKFWIKGQQMSLGIALSNKTDFGLVSSWDGIENMFDPNMTKIAELKSAKLNLEDWTEFTYRIDVPVKSDPDDIMYLDILFAGNGHTAYLDDMSLYNLNSAVPTVYINGAAVHNNDYVVADSYEIAQDNTVNVTANTYNGLTFNGWYNVDDLDNPISTETTISYTQRYDTPDVVAKFTGLENLFTYAGAERVPYEIYNTAGWFWTAGNGDGGMVGKSISSTESHTGVQSYMLEYKYNHGLGRTVKLEAGKSYQLTFWYKATAGNLYRFQIANRNSKTARKVNDTGFTFDDDHVAAYEAEIFSLVATEWTQETVSFDTAEGMDTIDIFFSQSGSDGDAFYLDDISIVEVFEEFSQLKYVDNTDPESLFRVYYTTTPDIAITYEHPVVAAAAGQTVKFKLYKGEEPENYSDLTGTNPFDQVEVSNGTWTLKYYTVSAFDEATEVVTKEFRIQDDAKTFCKYYTPGDVLEDGEERVNADDLYALRRYIAGYTVEGINKYIDALDVNGDGAINEQDAYILERYIAGYDGYALARGNILK